jgi:hypothetical protein
MFETGDAPTREDARNLTASYGRLVELLGQVIPK